MDARQRIRDLSLLLKQDRKAQVIAVIVIIFLVWGLFGSSTPKRRYAVQQPEQLEISTGAMGGREAYEDLVTRLGTDISEIRVSTEKNAEISNQLQQNMELYEKRTAEIFKKIIERMADIESNISNANQSAPSPIDVPAEDLGGLNEAGLAPWGDIKNVEDAPPPIPQKERIAIIGAGDSASVKLIAGVNAPTDGTPYPVIFQLDGPVQGPDGTTLPLGQARIIAAAQGSLSDQRALFRLTSLNITYPDGSKNVVDIDGWVVGEDGIRGMEGILVDPLGKILSGALLSGTVEGVGRGTSQSQVTTQRNTDGSAFSFIDGNTLDFALGQGIGEAGGKWGAIIDERAKQLVPHVKVLSGRNATAVFSKNIQITGLYGALESEEDPFISLD